MKELIEKFRKPEKKFGVYPFWFLNYILDKKILIKQLKEFKAKKIPGFFIHARSGLLFPPYGSDRWYDFIKFIVEESKKLSLNSEIYDEFDCPSGTAGEIIPILYPEYRAKFLKIFRKKITVGKNLFYSIPEGRIIKIFGIHKKKIYDLTENIGVVKERFAYSLKWSSKNYYLTEKDYKHTRAIAFEPKFCINFPNKGRWEIIVFYIKDKQRPEFTHQLYIDVLNPNSSEIFIKMIHDKYKKYVGKYFGKNIHYVFMDEPKMFSEFPWSDNLEELFKNKYKYSLFSNLYHLILNLDENSGKIRIHYRETLTELFKNNFIMKIKNWCNKNKLKLVGHISPEENIVQEGYLIGSLLDVIENFDIPGTDIIIPAIGDEKHKLLNRSLLLAVSVGEIKGSPIMCEAFACSDWHFTPFIMKKITDWMFVLGINFIVPHAFFYSIVGLRKYEASPSQFYQWTFWKYYEIYSKYVSRLSYIMQNTKPVVKICFLYPIKEIWKNLPDEKKCKEIEKKLDKIIFKLLSKHIRFNFISEEKLLDAVIDNDKIIIGEREFSILLLLKDTFISDNCKTKIEILKQKGVKIIEIGSLKDLESVYREKEKINEFLISGKNSEKIFINQKEKDGKNFYFLFNTSDKEIKVKIKLKNKKGIEIWNCLDGKIYPYPVKITKKDMILDLVFSPFQSFLFVESDKILKFKKENKFSRKIVFFNKEWEIRKCLNYFVIDKWIIKKDKRDIFKFIPCPIYRVFPELFSNKWKQTVFGKIPVDEVKEKKVEFITYFRVKEKLKGKLEFLLEESGVIGKHYIYLNGCELKNFKRKKEYDMFTLSKDITKIINVGDNEIKVVIYTNNPEAGIYSPFIIKGYFMVNNENEIISFKRNLKIGSWVNQGFPFFSGTIVYRQKFEIKKYLLNSEKVFLNFPEIKDVVEVKINGRNVGIILWQPFKIEVKKYLIEGINEFEFSVTNSNYNTFFKKKIKAGIIKSPYIEFLFFKKTCDGKRKNS